jgi:hypothetical protein
MGTTGYYCFIYNGKTYIFHNNMDSYPEALGQIIVSMIKMEDYKKWGDILVDKIDNKNSLVRKFEDNVEIHNTDTYKSELDDDEEEWFSQYFSGDKCITINKWDIKYFIKEFEIAKFLIDKCCPTLNRSRYIPDFKKEDMAKTADWVYTIDLNKELFTVSSADDTNTFMLDSIPHNWIQLFNKDREN